ncbi:helix-turn-helix domain-containing protein [Schumannella soli]|uniref:Helix-turn-helix transcriptional regulator n=1 Tax=Schumannella soli TaxID=2590779 RepID=A0A506Y444_9MICO|nr:helix-turn-helix transcriptional regulator [Schumannella soli]TPW76197.1 helix-turn-helix transcriptional regulator [Schumannella soli]
MTVVEDLRRARATSHTTLSQLAELTGQTRSNLSTLLAGTRDPQASTIERVANGLGLTVIAAPLGNRATVAQLVDRIADAVSTGNTSRAYRSYIQIADNLEAADPFTRILLAAQEPASIDARYDAAVAAVVDWRLSAAGLPTPHWAANRSGDPEDRWRIPAEFDDDQLPDAADVPDSFRNRGIWIDAKELTSA